MEKKFVFGAIDSIRIQDSDDLYLVGNGTGMIKEGDEVTLVNPGSDAMAAPVVTTVKEVSVLDKNDWIAVESAADRLMGIRLAPCSFIANKASVAYCGDVSKKEIQDTYVSALGDSYVSTINLDIPDGVLKTLSIADLAEIWRLNEWYHSTVKKFKNAEEAKENRKRLDKVCEALSQKILTADTIYCVFSVATGAPYLFSKTNKDGDKYLCTPPCIRIIPAAYLDLYKDSYPKERFDIMAIHAGEKKDGIINFLGNAFYMDGARGVEVITEKTTILPETLVDAPDYSNIPEEKKPVINPDAIRWMHLIGQMGAPKTDDEKLIHSLYFNFMSKAIVGHKLYVPAVNATDANDEGTKAVGLMIQKSNGPRPAMRAYTDWTRLMMAHKEKMGAVMVNPKDAIKDYDIALNFSGYPRSGIYITAEMFERMEVIAGEN